MALQLGTFSMGVGDRFGRQGRAQLAAFVAAAKAGISITPVWNKSNREHGITHTDPASVRAEADAAVRALGWAGEYHVDADHISLKNVDGFIAPSSFFTLDVADFVGVAAPEAEIAAFVERHGRFVGKLSIPGIGKPFDVTPATIEAAARKYLHAVREAGKIYRHIEKTKGAGTFVTEVSMDETNAPQTPVELLFILAAVAEEKIPAQTIAPKFTGRFNKGVDYVGDVQAFEREFNEDICVIRFAVAQFGLPANLKLSLHSGSDKFSIYPAIRAALKRHSAGLHVKTAGTTWLEEIAALAAAGGSGLDIAREAYAAAHARFDEFCGPYATVIDIARAKLPTVDAVRGWDGARFARAIRHDQKCPEYDANVRQLLHVGYKAAAEMGARYAQALSEHERAIADSVTANILERHMKAIFF